MDFEIPVDIQDTLDQLDAFVDAEIKPTHDVTEYIAGLTHDVIATHDGPNRQPLRSPIDAAIAVAATRKSASSSLTKLRV